MSIIHKFLVMEAMENTIRSCPESWKQLLKNASLKCIEKCTADEFQKKLVSATSWREIELAEQTREERSFAVGILGIPDVVYVSATTADAVFTLETSTNGRSYLEILPCFLSNNIVKAELVVTIIKKGDQNLIKNMFFGETNNPPTEVDLKGLYNPFMVVTRRKALEMGFIIAKLNN